MSHDLRALGRLERLATGPGTPGSRRRRRGRVTRRSDGLGYSAHRRPAMPRGVVLLLAAVIGMLSWIGFAASSEAPGIELGQETAASSASADPAGGATPHSASGGELRRRDSGPLVDRSARRPGAFAEVDGLALSLPVAEPILVAFQEATQATALEMAPLGRLVRNDNPEEFEGVPDESATRDAARGLSEGPGAHGPGPDYAVLASHGRPRAATSAADVVVPAGSLFAAPVTGTVHDVVDYVLPGGQRDWRVVITPDGRPGLRVVIVNVSDPHVAPGDRVEASRTIVGTVRSLPHRSHVDAVLDAPAPAIHIEVRPATAALPADPNEPALAPGEDQGAAGS